jgi:hypothetical protein
MRFVLKLTETDQGKDLFVKVIDRYSLYDKLFYCVKPQRNNDSSTSINFDNPTNNQCGNIDFNELKPSNFFGNSIQNKLKQCYGENYSKLSYMITWLPMNEDNFTYILIVKPILTNVDKFDENFEFVRSFIENLY